MEPLLNKSWIFFVVILFFSPAVTVPGKVIYVDDDAPGANNGSSWQDAYHYLQDALADANSAEKPVEIRVAQGIYKPDQGKNQTPRDRTATFQLQNGVTIKGGYPGFAEPDPNARDIRVYETILSGDLAGNDGNVNDLRDLLLHPTRIDNSYHVVRSAGVSESAALDRLTITAGNDDRPCPAPCLPGTRSGTSSSPPRYRPTPCDMGLGGGMLNANSSPTVIRCTFLENSAMQSGGAVCNVDCNSLSIIDCTFLRNYGCAMCNLNSNPKITNCTFRVNVGGGVSNFQSDSNFVRCVFVDNISSYYGGAIDNQNSSTKLTGCLFLRNSVRKYGGGIYNDTSSAELENCTFAKNQAGEEGGGIFAFAFKASLEHNHHIAISNTIFWENSSENGSQIALEGGTISIEYNVLQEGLNGVHDPYHGIMWGRGNSELDPLFADPNNDLHLKSQAGRWEPTGNSKLEMLNSKLRNGAWVKDDVTSPCIDSGDPGSPVADEPFPNGGRINMGAYGGTVEASKSYFGKPICQTIVAGDINGDCKIDFIDFAIVAAHWLEDNSPSGPVTTAYVFQPDPNALVISGGFGGHIHETYSVEGHFKLMVNFDQGTASFGDVDATLSEEVCFLDPESEGFRCTDSLGVLFQMTELVSTDVNHTRVKFALERFPGFPEADIHLELMFLDDSVRLVGGFCEPVSDGVCYRLDAHTVPQLAADPEQ